MKNKSAKALWGDFLDQHLEYAFDKEPQVDHFGDSEAVANSCLDLVLKGKKRATSHSLLGMQFRGEPLPRIGDLTIITDWEGTAHCIIRTVQVTLKPLFAITPAYAALEGEGDEAEAEGGTHEAAPTITVNFQDTSGHWAAAYIDQIEDILYDTRVRLTAPGGVDDRIVIVAIDEASLQRHGHWPFTREKFASMMHNLRDYGAAVVGFDVLFAERDESADVSMLRDLAGQEGDAAFVDRLNQFEPLLDRDRQRPADALDSAGSVSSAMPGGEP